MTRSIDRFTGLSTTGSASIDELWRAVGGICDMYDPYEYRNYFKAAGYAYD